MGSAFSKKKKEKKAQEQQQGKLNRRLSVAGELNPTHEARPNTHAAGFA
jgi:hypothetical protein